MARRQVLRHLDLERNVFFGGERLHRAEHPVHDVLERIIGERERELAGLDLGQVEHVVDQAEQVLAVALDPLEHVAHLLGRFAVDAVADQLGVAEDGVERRAQLVAHIGEELRLVLARLRELPALVLDLVEQPHVLDRDHRLVGEGGDQLDLLVGKRPDDAAYECEDSDRGAFAQQRHAEHGVEAAELARFDQTVVRVGLRIEDMDRRLFLQRAADGATAPGPDRRALHQFHQRGRHAVVRLHAKEAIVGRARDVSHVGLAQPHRRFDQRVEHRFEIEGRAADDFQHVGGGGLLLQRFAQLAEQTGILERNDALVREGGHQLDLPLGEWPHRAPRQHDDADRSSFAQKRHTQHRPHTADFRGLDHVELGINENVENVNGLAFEHSSPGNRAPSERDRVRLHEPDELGWIAVLGELLIGRTSLADDRGHVRIAQPRRRLDQRFEHDL